MSVQVGVQKMCTDAVKMVDAGKCAGQVGLFVHSVFDLSVCTEFGFDHIEQIDLVHIEQLNRSAHIVRIFGPSEHTEEHPLPSAHKNIGMTEAAHLHTGHHMQQLLPERKEKHPCSTHRQLEAVRAAATPGMKPFLPAAGRKQARFFYHHENS